MRILFVVAIGLLATVFACKENDQKQSKDQEKPDTLMVNSDPGRILAAMEQAYGGWNNLRGKRDVEYHYAYTVPQGKADLSTERYMFDDEISFGHYTRHEINTMPKEKGVVTHLFDGEKTTITLNENVLENEKTISTAQFVRRANYFWFVMPYKLNDPGTIARYLGAEIYKGTAYDKLEITYDAAITGKEKNDIYILYINQDTKMIDRFYFSLPFLGINDPVIIATYQYESVADQKIAVKRNYFLPNSDGGYSADPSITQTLTNIKFNNGFTMENIALTVE